MKKTLIDVSLYWIIGIEKDVLDKIKKGVTTYEKDWINKGNSDECCKRKIMDEAIHNNCTIDTYSIYWLLYADSRVFDTYYRD